MSEIAPSTNRENMLGLICDLLALNIADVSEDVVLADLGPVWDSVGMLSVIVAVEQQTGNSIPPQDLVESKTIGDLINLALANGEGG